MFREDQNRPVQFWRTSTPCSNPAGHRLNIRERPAKSSYRCDSKFRQTAFVQSRGGSFGSEPMKCLARREASASHSKHYRATRQRQVAASCNSRRPCCRSKKRNRATADRSQADSRPRPLRRPKSPVGERAAIGEATFSLFSAAARTNQLFHLAYGHQHRSLEQRRKKSVPAARAHLD